MKRARRFLPDIEDTWWRYLLAYILAGLTVVLAVWVTAKMVGPKVVAIEVPGPKVTITVTETVTPAPTGKR